VKSQVMTLEFEFPVNGVEIVFFVGETYAEAISENIGDMVKPFQASVIGNDGFGTS
jgi:hypothetical protein